MGTLAPVMDKHDCNPAGSIPRLRHDKLHGIIKETLVGRETWNSVDL